MCAETRLYPQKITFLKIGENAWFSPFLLGDEHSKSDMLLLATLYQKGQFGSIEISTNPF